MKKERIWGVYLPVIISSIIIFCGLSALLYTAWLKGDDFFFVCDDPFAASKVYGSIHCYLNHVSRFGELLGRMVGLSANRWQNWVFTPLILVILPFVMAQLVQPRKIVSAGRMLAFYWFACFMLLQSVAIMQGYWRNFWCYAAAVNYLWGTAICMLFLVYMFPQRWDNCHLKGWKRFLCCVVMFGAGCCSGWSIEAVTVVLLPLLVGAMVWYRIKSGSVPMPCWSGLAGMGWGAFLLLGSPALSRRSVNEAATRALDVYTMSSEQLTDFLQNLTPEKMKLLEGSSGVVNLAGIPMLQHMYFLPFLAERYWNSCMIPTIAFAILQVLTLWLRPESWKQSSLLALGIYALSWLSACSYLGGCVPTHMSFLPQSFMVVIACSLLFLKLRGRYAKQILTCITLMVVAMGLMKFVPAGVEAWQYKKYEKERFESIARQKAAGCEVIILPQPSWPVEPEDSLGLIRSMDFGPGVNDYPNGPARAYFKVQGIMKEKVSENAH